MIQNRSNLQMHCDHHDCEQNAADLQCTLQLSQIEAELSQCVALLMREALPCRIL